MPFFPIVKSFETTKGEENCATEVRIIMQPLQDPHRQVSTGTGSARTTPQGYMNITMQILLPLSKIFGSFVLDPL